MRKYRNALRDRKLKAGEYPSPKQLRYNQYHTTKATVCTTILEVIYWAWFYDPTRSWSDPSRALVDDDFSLFPAGFSLKNLVSDASLGILLLQHWIGILSSFLTTCCDHPVMVVYFFVCFLIWPYQHELWFGIQHRLVHRWWNDRGNSDGTQGVIPIEY